MPENSSPTSPANTLCMIFASSAACYLLRDPACDLKNKIDDLQPVGDSGLRQNKTDKQAEHLFRMPELPERGCLLKKGHRKEQDQQAVANALQEGEYLLHERPDRTVFKFLGGQRHNLPYLGHIAVPCPQRAFQYI